MNGINAPQRPDCVTGHVRFELRNVDANYPFERSHRFAGIQPNSGFGDHSRLSCGVGDTQLGRRPGSRLARATPAELARIPRIRTEFRPGRLLAFELQRRQLGAGFCRDLQQAFCTDVGHYAASSLLCHAQRAGRAGVERVPLAGHHHLTDAPRLCRQTRRYHLVRNDRD